MQTRALGHIDTVSYLDPRFGGERQTQARVPRGSLVSLRGWAALEQGPDAVAGVFAMIDDGPLIEVVSGFERSDVAAAMDDESFARSGFRGVLSTLHLASGSHGISIAIRRRDGALVWLLAAASFSIEDPIEQRLLEAPNTPIGTPIVLDERCLGSQKTSEPITATQADVVVLRGWGIDESAKALASDVYAIVGRNVFRAEYGAPREDVARAHNDERFRNSGFTVEIPLDAIEPGPHVIRLRLVGADGHTMYDGPHVAVVVAPFATNGTLEPAGRPTLGLVDKMIAYDASGKVVAASEPFALDRGDQLFLSGWAIDEPGDAIARAVHLCIDGMASTPAVYGIERRDVARHFHRPDLAACGFSAVVATATMPSGEHTAVIRIVDRTGTRFYEAEQRISFEVR